MPIVDDDDRILSDEEVMEIIEKKREENDKHYFQIGHKWAYATFRHVIRQLESNPDKCVEVLARYLSSYHENNFEDRDYCDAYVGTEDKADEIISEFDQHQENRNGETE